MTTGFKSVIDHVNQNNFAGEIGTKVWLQWLQERMGGKELET